MRHRRLARRRTGAATTVPGAPAWKQENHPRRRRRRVRSGRGGVWYCGIYSLRVRLFFLRSDFFVFFYSIQEKDYSTQPT
jgi:hypothetical protein